MKLRDKIFLSLIFSLVLFAFIQINLKNMLKKKNNSGIKGESVFAVVNMQLMRW